MSYGTCIECGAALEAHHGINGLDGLSIRCGHAERISVLEAELAATKAENKEPSCPNHMATGGRESADQMKSTKPNPDGETCSLCGHEATGIWQWAPGHLGGYRCNCCMRRTWEETMENLKKSLAELPKECS